VSNAGRPTIYSQKLCDDICQEIALGGNLNKICARDEMPAPQTIYRWRHENAAFSESYSRARESRSDARSDRMDDYTARMLDGSLDANVVRVALINEQWQAARESAKRYGDKLTHSNDPDAPIVPVLNVTVKSE
jgi:terminase small subunit-like protein